MSAPQNHFPSVRGVSLQGFAEPPVAQISSQPQQPIEENPASGNNGDTSAYLSFGLFVFALLLFLLKYLQGRKKPSSPTRHPELRHHHPCSKCRFFNQNPYLQCAVHPENFDRIAPKDCPDFWAVDQDEFLTK
jgi:hypothetical protein